MQLTGETFDLEELPQLFRTESLRVVLDQGQYYVERLDFDALDDAGQVREAARAALNNINGAARLVFENFKPVQLGVVQKIGPEATTTHHFLEVGTGELRMKGHAVVVTTGGPPPEPAPSPATKWLAAAQSSEPVRRVLGYLAQPTVSWADLYKVIEAVQENDGSHLIGTVVSKKTIDRITNTANSREAIGDRARHGHNKYRAPKKQLQLPEATAVVHQLVRAWIDSKV